MDGEYLWAVALGYAGAVGSGVEEGLSAVA